MQVPTCLKTVAGKAAGTAAVLCLVAVLMPAAALAEGEEVSGSVECNSWTLGYSIQDEEATITGVETVGAATELSLPATIDGAAVTAVSERAFYGESTLKSVELPASLELLGNGAFMNTGLERIDIPASVEYIPYQCFRGCTELSEVVFEEGSSPEYLGTQAFYSCEKLAELDIPALVGTDFAKEWVCYTPTTTNPGYGAFRIGKDCFVNCKKLKKVVFEAGNETGMSEYLKDGGEQFGNNASGLEIFVHCPGSTARYASQATWYFCLDFYKSKEDADADKGRTKPWKRVVCKSGTTLLEIVKGTVADAPHESGDDVPEIPQEAADAGNVWGIADGVMTSASTTLSKLCVVYPVQKADLSYGWVTSPEILTAAGYNTFSSVVNSNGAYVRLCADGTADLSGMAAYAADGSKLDSSLRTFVYERGETVVDPDRPPFTKTVWTELDSGDAITEAGLYRVHAVGTGEYSTTETATVSFNVKKYTSNVFDYTSTKRAEYLGNAVFSATSALGSADEASKFMVVAPASDWRYCLVAAALAGVGGGQAVFTDGSNTTGSAYAAIQASGVSDIIFVGSESQIGADVVARIRQNVGKSGSFDFLEGSSADTLAVNVFETVQKYGPKQSVPYQWGDTAVVVSGTYSMRAAAAAQYAYQAQAPVFYAAADGSVSSKTLAALKSGAFSKVVVAGGTDCVSASAAASISSACGVEPVRILSQRANTADAVQDLIATLQGTFTQDGAPVNDSKSVVLASSLDPASVIAAAQLAAVRGCVLMTAASTADVKSAELYLVQTAADMTNVVYLVGDLDAVGSGSKARFESVWDATPQSTVVGKGDTVEAGGLLYKLTSATAATLAKPVETTLSQISANSFTAGSKTYTVTAVGASALKGYAALTKFTSSATTIGASAFQGCTKLASATLSAKTIGASAFQGCTALKTLNTSATTIGASAFQGCTALKTLNTSATTIGASAFQGCTALKTLSTSATTIGASAFQGCTALAKAKLTSKKLAGLSASLFQGCSKLASVTVSSTALKTVGNKAFSGCTKLKSMALTSKKVVKIGSKAFYACSSLASVVEKSTNLKAIGASAFAGCKKLKTLTLKTKKLKTVASKAFKSTYAKMKVKVPKAKIAAYTKLLRKAGLSKKAKVVKV